MMIRLAIIGASGYTGAECVRLAAAHPNIDIKALTGERHRGQPMGAVYAHLAHLDLPDLIDVQEVNFDAIDVVICGLPHGLSQTVLADLPVRVRIIDLSADFRLRDPADYEAWYGKPHQAKALQKQAVYGLTELNRPAIATARLVANPGCYPTAALLCLQPLLAAGLIASDPIIIDAKSGVSGAGRSLAQDRLFCEVAESLRPYGVGHHRHMVEIDQELNAAKDAGGTVQVSFTPHLVPMNRGELVTCYVHGEAQALLAHLQDVYADEPFVLVGEQIPTTADVRGSNCARLCVRADRKKGRAIVIGVIDNLLKGASGMAIQNLNVMAGWDETLGLSRIAQFP